MAEKNFVRSMFNNIAPTYDKLNHILSLNIDKIWRKKAVKRIVKNLKNSESEKLKNNSQVFRFSDSQVLDVACGTADSTIALAKAGVPRVTGVDISEEIQKTSISGFPAAEDHVPRKRNRCSRFKLPVPE